MIKIALGCAAILSLATAGLAQTASSTGSTSSKGSMGSSTTGTMGTDSMSSKPMSKGMSSKSHMSKKMKPAGKHPNSSTMSGDTGSSSPK